MKEKETEERRRRNLEGGKRREEVRRFGITEDYREEEFLT